MTPVWRDLPQLLKVLDRYREWMRQGLSDTQITAEMRRVQLHNGRQS